MKELVEQTGVVTEVLRHCRHEQLNQLQLIKGYTELGNPERVLEIIDELIFQARQETKLSNMKLIKTGELFMTFNWGIHQFKLEFEIVGNGTSDAPSDDLCSKWCREFFQIVDTSADLADENVLSVTIHAREEEFCFVFDFSGKLKSINGINQYVGNHIDGLDIHIHECSSHVFSIEMRIKR